MSCSSRWSATPCARSTSRRGGSTSTWGSSVRINVFTLFPHWFDWFRTQRHVANALALGHALEPVDYRPTTPLKAGKVDDVPFGGGAGTGPGVRGGHGALRARSRRHPLRVPLA